MIRLDARHTLQANNIRTRQSVSRLTAIGFYCCKTAPWPQIFVIDFAVWLVDKMSVSAVEDQIESDTSSEGNEQV